MKQRKIWSASVVMLVLLLVMTAIVSGRTIAARNKSKQVDIIFTSDLHSHLNSFYTLFEGEKTEVGGFARIKSIIDQQREDNPDTMVLDAGDFSMGTLVQNVFESKAAELRMLGTLGFDVTTLGNHEFDYRSSGLKNMLQTAKQQDTLPEMVLCNVDWDAMEDTGLTQGQKLIQEGFETYGVREYVVLQKGGVKIAVTGVMGKDSIACAPTCELIFKDPVKAVKETVQKIQENEDVDMIVCVSHSGTDEQQSKSEDEILAKKVPQLDLIISGHTHTKLDEPIVHGDTYIVSVGEYGEYVGSMALEQRADGRWNISNYELIPVTNEIVEDIEIQKIIDGFYENVDEEYLSKFGYTRKQVLANNEVEFCELEDLSNLHEEQNLGSLIADSYVYTVASSDGYEQEPITIAVVPSGTIRDTYTIGDITVEDVFNSFSLGIGADGVPGYPLIGVYLTGKELQTIAEIDASISDHMQTARLYTSGLNFTFNPNRIILNKVTDAYVTDTDQKRVEIKNDKLYYVVADLYSGQMLSAVTDMSYGLLSIVPKYKDGTKIEDFEDVILKENGKELKAWDAIARYMNSFEDTDGDGIGNVPTYYASEHGRKVIVKSKNLIELIKNPNRFIALYCLIIVVVLVLVTLLVLLVVKMIRRFRSSFRNDTGNRGLF